MKILMTTDTVGGVWNYSLELCRSLFPYNVEIHLMSLGAFPSKKQIAEVKAIPNIAFYPTHFKLEWMENPWEDIEKTEEKIYRLCKIIQPDLLHFNNFVKSGRMWDVPVVTVFHSCVQTWWQAVNGENVPQEWNDYLELVEDSLNSSDLVIFPTEAIRNAAWAAHRIYTESLVVHNCRELAITGKAKKEKIILCTGRIWDEAKNLSLLCSLADQLPWPIYVAGATMKPNSSEKMELNNVRFLGKLNTEEMNYWLERTEIYVNPTLYEPFGLAVLEAAKARCALVLSNLETLTEVWGENALYFNPRNGREITEKLLHLIENDCERKEYQQKAKLHSHKYNGTVLGKSYFEIYQSLTNKEEKFLIEKETMV